MDTNIFEFKIDSIASSYRNSFSRLCDLLESFAILFLSKQMFCSRRKNTTKNTCAVDHLQINATQPTNMLPILVLSLFLWRLGRQPNYIHVRRYSVRFVNEVNL